MPVLANLNEKDKNKDQANAPSTPAPSVVSGPSSTIQTGQPAQRAPGTATSSGRFTNLNKFLDANKTADVAKGIGDQTEKTASGVREGIQKGLQGFQGQTQSNTQNYNTDIAAAINDDPTKLLNNAEALSKFKSLTGGYAGPSQFSSGQEAQVAKLTGLENLAGNESGRYQLLRESFGTPKYTGGQQKLDQLLLQKKEGSIPQLQQALHASGQAVTAAEAQAQQDAASAVQTARNTSTETQNRYRSDIAGQHGNILGELSAKARQANADQAQRIENAKNAFRRGEIDPGLNISGSSSDELRSFIKQAGEEGINPNDYLRVNPLQEATAQNIGSGAQNARISALQALSGLSGSQLNGGNFTGGFNPNAGLSSSFDKQKLSGDLAEIRNRRAAAAESAKANSKSAYDAETARREADARGRRMTIDQYNQAFPRN